MPSPSFTLDAQLRFHDKWLKIDLQVHTPLKENISVLLNVEDSAELCGFRNHRVPWGTGKISKASQC